MIQWTSKLKKKSNNPLRDKSKLIYQDEAPGNGLCARYHFKDAGLEYISLIQDEQIVQTRR